MSDIKIANVVLRPKRQITLPKEICSQLGLEPGDTLELLVEDHALIAKPRKNTALDALKEIQQAFQHSGITEEELQKAGRRTRQAIAKERYSAEG